MMIHLFFGSLVFVVFGNLSTIELRIVYFLTGAFFGILPDFISFALTRSLKINKWSHQHRDSFSHSVFLYLLLFAVGYMLKSEIAMLASVAMLSHPLLDTFGIGWGVKLFYPLSDKIFKLGFQGKLFNFWTREQADEIAEKFGDDDWVRNTYAIFSHPNFFGVIEWLMLLAWFLILVRILMINT